MNLWREQPHSAGKAERADTRDSSTENGASLASDRYSLIGAATSGFLSFIVLCAPIAMMVFLGITTWTGGWFKEDPSGPQKTESIILFALAGLLVADIIAWTLAGFLKFPLLLTTVAAAPPAVLGLVFAIGVFS